MNPTSLELGSTHVLDIMTQGEDMNIPSTLGTSQGIEDNLDNISIVPSGYKSMSDTNEMNFMSQEHDYNIKSTRSRRLISDISSTDDLNTITQDHGSNPQSPFMRSPSLPNRRNVPCFDLVRGSKEDYMEVCLPLYEASITGDWEAAKIILDKRPELVRFALTPGGQTALHIALSVGGTKQMEKFVENLLNMMEIEDLELENNSGEQAFIIVVATGSFKMAELMLNKHRDLLSINPDKTLQALSASTVYGNHKMTAYLYNFFEKMVCELWSDKYRASFFILCIKAAMYDIALKVLTDHKIIGTSVSVYYMSLNILARRPDALVTAEPGRIWRIVDPTFAIMHRKKGSPDVDNQALDLLKTILDFYLKTPESDMFEFGEWIDEDDIVTSNTTLPGILFTAAETGNTRFVIEVIRRYPTILCELNNDGHSIFHIAVMHRHKDIYNILYEIGTRKFQQTTQKDSLGNIMLHLVGKTSNNMQVQTVSGASLLMQRELLWFKEVERMTPAVFRNTKNKDGRTPYELFSENNQDLVSRGLKWTKDCMVVATLIITIAFAAAFTIPGGYNQETGIPIFNHESSFLVFIIADAVALFSSSTSLLVFLSILTSPYGQRDFLNSLPIKLMIGLVTLFISVSAIMVTFAASFFVIFRNTFKWVPLLISILAAIPVIIYAALQYPFLMDMFRSMYDSRYLFKPRRRMLYNSKRKL